MRLTDPRLWFSPLLLCVFLRLFPSCSPAPARKEFALGTVCGVNLYERGSRRAYAAVFSRIREIEGIMSANLAGTELDRVNRSAGRAAVAVSGELLDLLEKATAYAEMSGGAFDPTVGPLVKLWGIGGGEPRLPGQSEIAAALDLVDYRDLLIDREAGTAFLRRPGQALDLGAIAKGYAADEAVRAAEKAGARRAIIDLGGNVFAWGERRKGEAWRIGVQDPRKERGGYLGVLRVKNKSVVTSGVYERYFEEGGKRYHHILSTKDGYPVENGLLAVTVTADSSAEADALSTAVFALGYKKGRALVEARPGVEAVFVFDGSRLILSSGMGEFFSLSGEDYRIVEQASLFQSPLGGAPEPKISEAREKTGGRGKPYLSPSSSISKTIKLFAGISPFPTSLSP
ncbi:MAG: FAD:protein FMN transferase [Treponema sp.]|jgi:thiamine biosynthesis lipoprotein|nr:FAD:protein FMN transferase [Treponema sp.]